MKVYGSIKARFVIFCLFVLFVVTTRAQKKINVDDSKLNVVVVGDIGVPESESDVKKQVVRTIRLEHRTLPFTLGLNLGANVYPRGSVRNDFYTLQTLFTDYFPPHVFEFDFLTIPGPIDYEGDLQTQINYRDYQPRFYMPEKSYFYDVELNDRTSIRFICIDSTPIYEPGWSNKFIQKVTTRRISDQIDIYKSWLDNSGNFEYVFVVLHHNIVDGCGPNREFPDNPDFAALTTHPSITGIITAQNRNMQMFGPLLNRPPVMVVGNSARVGQITASNTLPAWCDSPASGGFAELIVTKDFAYFKFVNGAGYVLADARMAPRKRT